MPVTSGINHIELELSIFFKFYLHNSLLLSSMKHEIVLNMKAYPATSSDGCTLGISHLSHILDI